MPIVSVAISAWLATAAPLTLDDALATAARRNGDLALARLDEEAAAADVSLSWQGVLPRLDLTASLGHQFQGEQQQVNVVTNPAPPPEFVRQRVTYPANDFGAYQAGLAFNLPIFDGLASWNAISASRTRSTAAKRLVDEAAMRVAFDVTRRFYEVVRQQRALEVRREAAALSEELVARADALFKAGRGTKADTFSARVNLGNDRIAARNQVAVLERARADLAVALGFPSGAGLEVAPPEPVAGGGAPETGAIPALDALLAKARDRRPALAAGRLAGRAGDIDVARARGAWWPVLGVSASYQKMTPELGGEFGLLGNPSRQNVFTTELTISWNLFAGGSTQAGITRAEVDARRAWTVLEEQERVVAAEVTTAREVLAALVDTTAVAEENLKAASEGLRYARERLDAGVGSQLEVRDTVVKLSEAKLAWVSTVVDLVVARADLNRAVGGGL